MTDILVTIDCDGGICGECEGFDSQRDHCDIFSEFIDVESGERCTACHEAEEQAKMLTEEFTDG